MSVPQSNQGKPPASTLMRLSFCQYTLIRRWDTLPTMPSKLLKLGGWVGVTVLLVLLVVAADTWLKRRQEVDTVSDEQKIARTLEIIRTSTPKIIKC